MKVNNLRDVFVEQLKDVYSAEKQLIDALPKMVSAASAPDLKELFENHLEQTRRQCEDVRRVLEALGANPGNKICKAMRGLIEEASEMAEADGDPHARDAGIVAAAQKVEHYEIATYGSLTAWSKTISEPYIAALLQDILNEEYDADNKLDRIAEGHLNRQAE